MKLSWTSTHILLSIACLFVGVSNCAAQTDTMVVTPGIGVVGKIELGFTKKEASRNLGAQKRTILRSRAILIEGGPSWSVKWTEVDRTRNFWRHRNPEITILFSDGKVKQIEFGMGKWKTQEGLKIGDTIKLANELYGKTDMNGNVTNYDKGIEVLVSFGHVSGFRVFSPVKVSIE